MDELAAAVRPGLERVEDLVRLGVAGAEVVLVTVEGGGHAWPGGDRYLPDWAIGKTSRDIDASEELWKFFQRHALP